jgi:hypothetical protein
MALCHKVVAERMDQFEMKQNKLSSEEDHRQSIGSCSQRSTSMSALRLPISINLPHEHEHEEENEPKDALEQDDESETRPAMASVDLTPHRGSASTSLFEFSGRSEVVPLESEKEPSQDTWLNYSCSYFLRGCHGLKLISMEDM